MLGKFLSEEQPGQNTAMSAFLFGIGAIIMTASIVGALAGAGFGIVAMGLGGKYLNDDEIEPTPQLARMAKGGSIMGGFAFAAAVVVIIANL